MMSLIQILSVVFGLFMLYVVRIHSRKRELQALESVAWFIVWLGFIYLALFPQTFKKAIEILHIARVFDLLLIIALMILTVVVFQNRVNSKKIQKKLEDIVRKEALSQKNSKI